MEAERPELKLPGVLHLARRDEKVTKIATQMGAQRIGERDVADGLGVRKDGGCRLGECDEVAGRANSGAEERLSPKCKLQLKTLAKVGNAMTRIFRKSHSLDFLQFAPLRKQMRGRVLSESGS